MWLWWRQSGNGAAECRCYLIDGELDFPGWQHCLVSDRLATTSVDWFMKSATVTFVHVNRALSKPQLSFATTGFGLPPLRHDLSCFDR